MEKIMSVEEKVRRAEEIYLRRKNLSGTQNRTQKVPINDTKKDVKLLKKMIMQIIVCVCIYIVVYVVQNSGTFFSENFIIYVLLFMFTYSNHLIFLLKNSFFVHLFGIIFNLIFN